MKNLIFVLLMALNIGSQAASLIGAHQGEYLRTEIPAEVRTDFSQLLGFKTSEPIVDSDDAQLLVEHNLDSRLKSPNPSTGWDREKSKGQLYAEGSGTRGGGSGVLIPLGNNIFEVKLLDIYRSEKLDLFPLFFAPDPELLNLSATASTQNIESTANKIYEVVMGRIKEKFPSLEQSIRGAEKEIPFKRWQSSVSEFPIIEDYIGKTHLREGEQQVQIAYRHTNQLVYNEKFYLLMDAFNRAALRLHEYIYASASTKVSVQVQRLVSLVMSSKFKDPNFLDAAKLVLAEAHLAPLATKSLNLPSGVAMTEDQPGSDDLCGLMKEIRLTKKKNLKIKFEFDPDHQQMTRQDLNLEQMIYFKTSDKIETKEIKIKDEAKRNQFLIALYFAKSELSKKYPLFLYPAQSVPIDFICINKHSEEISFFEMSVRYNKDKNDEDLKLAQAEAEYFKVQREYVLMTSKNNENPLAGFEKIDVHMQLKRQEIEILTIKSNIKLKELFNKLSFSFGSELGGYRLKFTN